jgi:hypothetical protein
MATTTESITAQHRKRHAYIYVQVHPATCSSIASQTNHYALSMRPGARVAP